MIVVRLQGGLGNQMFQYAVARALSLRSNSDLKLDLSFYDLNLKNVTKRNYSLNVFNISPMIANNSDIPFIFRVHKNKVLIKVISRLRRVFKTKGIEKAYHFDPNILTLRGNVYLDGYWQSPKYFLDFEETIRKDFTLKNELPQKVKDLASEISGAESLCIHVRRGDYVGNSSHEVVTKSYYDDCIKIISKDSKIEKIYVFSDDIAWCKNNLNFSIPTMFVSDEFSGSQGECHMYLMSLCKYFIIPNSSFSWWAAWLGVRLGKKVIAPKLWFPDPSINTSDLIPENWLRI